MNILKSIRSRIILSLILLSGVIGLATTLTDDFEVAKNLEIYSDIYRDLNVYYVDEVDPEKLMETGLNAMLKSMDPYTTYIPSDEVEQFRSSITGQYAGVGASVINGEDYVTIAKIYKGTPADRAKLQMGDQIVSAGGVSLKGLNVQEVSKYLRGRAGTSINVQIKRPGVKKLLDIELERENVRLTNIPYYDVLDDNMGYIALTKFTKNAGKNVTSALMELRNKTELKGIILDLRGNTGGLLAEAVNVVNAFVPKGEFVVTMKGRDKEKHQAFRTLNNPVDTETPLIVLIDEESASASEIVAGAIQDLDRGLIMGRKSFGKGLVQNTKDLPFGAKLKVTTARYYIPSGRCIQALKYKDGKPVSIPDSLREVFKTRNGRMVYDGGGINPDIHNPLTEFKEILEPLEKQNLLFRYSVMYKQEHDKIQEPKNFKLKDNDFEDFLKFLDKNGFEYKTETEEQLAELEKKAKMENYDEIVKPQLVAMEKILNSNKMAKLNSVKSDILNRLQRMIVLSYHYDEGAYANMVLGDSDVAMATKVLSNVEKYDQKLKK